MYNPEPSKIKAIVTIFSWLLSTYQFIRENVDSTDPKGTSVKEEQK